MLKHIYSHRTIARNWQKRKAFKKTTTKSFRAIKKEEKENMKGGGAKRTKSFPKLNISALKSVEQISDLLFFSANNVFFRS